MTRAMAGQAIPLQAKVRSAIAIFRAFRDGSFGGSDWVLRYHDWLCAQFQEYVGIPISGARLLDIGCGQLAKQVALFSSRGARITGIDVEVPTYRLSPAALLRVARENGIERAVKSAVRHTLFDRRMMDDLRARSGRPLDFRRLDARVMDACDMTFESDSIDFVFSHSVFEHIADVPAAVREVNRVIQPRGLVLIATHLFPSLSGGHNLAWLNPDTAPSTTVPPWDHLRERRFPVDTYMNELKVDQYRAIFREHFDVFREEVSTEGEALLTSELEAELGAKGFSREDLLTRVLTIFARKRT